MGRHAAQLGPFGGGLREQGLGTFMPRRPLNKCKDCDYTWNPRGNEVSKESPRCEWYNIEIDFD